MNELIELDENNGLSRDQMTVVQQKMSEMDQVELPTEHYFSESGMYCRKVFRPEGTLIVGKVHKHPHLFICAMGEILVWTESGTVRLTEGDVVESPAGVKRITYAVTDAIGITVHRTDKRDLNEIEQEIIEPDDSSMFDSNNILKIANHLKMIGEES